MDKIHGKGGKVGFSVKKWDILPKLKSGLKSKKEVPKSGTWPSKSGKVLCWASKSGTVPPKVGRLTGMHNSLEGAILQCA